ncbi:MAG: hypothetical protein LBH95_00345 [Oscillospiraceae bacterium]|jgi:hypothetical protein|nr:hypothetical protein [Oscillospiraceae bacterium]
MKKRILSLALAFVLTLVLVPFVPAVAAPPAGSIIQDPDFYAAVPEEIGKPDGYAITAGRCVGDYRIGCVIQRNR